MDDYTKLLLHCDGVDGSTTFTDSSRFGQVVTVQSNAQIDTAVQKFGTGSCLLDGNSDYLTIPASGYMQLGAGDWTLEMQVKFNNLDKKQQMFHRYTANNNELQFNINSENRLYMYMYANSAYQFYYYTGADTINDANWHHVVFVRNGNTPYIFVDGVSQNLTTHTAFSGALSDINSVLYMGVSTYNSTLQKYFDGYMDEIRISIGLARWTENFTAPTKSYNLIKGINGVY